MAVNASYKTTIEAVEVTTSNTAGQVVERVAVNAQGVNPATLADGNAAGQADTIWSISGTLAASTRVEHDLQNLTGSKGTVTFAGVKVIYLEHLGESGTITVGGAASTPWDFGSSSTVTYTVNVGGVFHRAEPTTAITVNAGAKVLKLNPGAGTIPYRLVIVGI